MSRDASTVLHGSLSVALRAALGDSARAIDPSTPLLGPSRNPQFGDFQSNAAMQFAKPAGRNPRELAQQMVLLLAADADFTSVAEPPEVAGPGFINIRLKPEALGNALAALDTPALGIEKPARTETVVVDLCGVNLAKQMHVGHLRATVIGDCLARLWERRGHRVIRQNHFGDWGLNIAMVTEAILRAESAGKLDLDSLNLDGLEKVYRAAQKEGEADERGLAVVHKYGLGPKAEAELGEQVAGAREATHRAQAALVALQNHEPEHYKIWQRICEITLASCYESCARLGLDRAKFQAATAGESTFAQELAPLVDDLVRRGIAVESDGALVIPLEEAGIKEPLIIRKRSGGFLYATTDLAGIRRRVQTLGASRVVYAVDARQAFHFKQVFAGAHKAGLDRRPDGASAELFHAAFGMVLGEDNRPYKTRSGENVKLSDLLDEAVARAERAVAEKNPGLPPGERRTIAEAVGMSAIKYADLSSDRIKDYVFSFDRMLAFEGNTGPYLQYAFVRVRSIFRKAQEQFGISESRFDGPDAPAFLIQAPEEKAIALELLKYPGVIASTADASEPHRLCTYLYDLATAFSTFFAACPVLQAPDEPTRFSRLRLSRLTGRVLHDGLRCLGLTPLERM